MKRLLMRNGQEVKSFKKEFTSQNDCVWEAKNVTLCHTSLSKQIYQVTLDNCVWYCPLYKGKPLYPRLRHFFYPFGQLPC